MYAIIFYLNKNKVYVILFNMLMQPSTCVSWEKMQIMGATGPGDPFMGPHKLQSGSKRGKYKHCYYTTVPCKSCRALYDNIF